MAKQRKRHKYALPTFCMGIVSLGLPWAAVFTPLHIIALILGSVALSDMSKSPDFSGKGYIIAGITCAALGGAVAGLFAFQILPITAIFPGR
ncbi:MAG: hypothetical protein ACE5IC_04945 [Candidatus Brocadiales bacterium]